MDSRCPEERKYTLLEAAVELAPLIKEVIPLGCSIAVADTEKFLCDFPSEELNLKDNTGRPLPKEGGIYKSIQTGEPVSKVLPKELYGIPFRSSNVPLKDHTGRVVGAIGVQGLSVYITEIENIARKI